MRILLLQLKRIGDLVLTTPALAALRRALPDASLTLVISDAAEDLVPALQMVDQVLVFRRHGSNSKVWWQLASSGYDSCLDFTGNDRSALFALLSKSGKRGTYQWVRKSAGRALFYNRFVDSPVRDRHTIDHHLDLLEALEIKVPPTGVELDIPGWARSKARQKLADAGIDGPFIQIHPGSARREKYWEDGRWAEIIRWSQRNYGLPTVISGSNERTETEHVGAILKQVGKDVRVVNLCGELDLLTLSGVLERASLVLGVDSAAMHLASAFGKRQIALFGPTNPFHWRPRHSLARVIVPGVSGAPTSFEPRAKGGPMSEISTQQVIDVISSLMPACYESDRTDGN